MADTTNGSGGGGGLKIIVGGLVVVVGLLAFVFLGGNIGGSRAPAQLDIKIETPKANP
jgi:hypothetical protein